MRIVECDSKLGRDFVLLAPQGHTEAPFAHTVYDGSLHQLLLGSAQRLRGRIYLGDGAIRQEQLSPDGRHVQSVDEASWHLLTVNDRNEVVACIRYHSHKPGVAFPALTLSRSLRDQSSDLAPRVRNAVQAHLSKANKLGLSYVELGGWAVGAELRCTTEAFRMLLAAYALGELFGGALALSTATTKHNSSSILKRIGGKPLMECGIEVPSYFDSHYNCEMELLSFESFAPNPRYAGWVREFKLALLKIPVISSESVPTSFESLARLEEAVSSHANVAPQIHNLQRPMSF
jgi:hypothetical protein